MGERLIKSSDGIESKKIFFVKIKVSFFVKIVKKGKIRFKEDERMVSN